MAYIRSIHEDEADGKLFELYDEIQRNRGRVSNILRAQSLNPKGLRAHLDLYMATCFGKGGLSRREAEVLAVVVSAINGDSYGMTHHKEALARYADDAPGLVEQLSKDPQKAKVTPREKALVNYAAALTKLPIKGIKESVDALRASGLKDEEILQAAQIIGYFNLANRMALGLGVELEAESERDYHY